MLLLPVLSFPNKDDKLILYTDGSEFAIGCTLCQILDVEEKVIAYASGKLFYIVIQ